MTPSKSLLMTGKDWRKREDVKDNNTIDRKNERKLKEGDKTFHKEADKKLTRKLTIKNIQSATF